MELGVSIRLLYRLLVLFQMVYLPSINILG